MTRRDCFAYRDGECTILNATPPDDCEDCRFRKPDRDMTDGRAYGRLDYLSGYIPKPIHDKEGNK